MHFNTIYSWSTRWNIFKRHIFFCQRVRVIYCIRFYWQVQILPQGTFAYSRRRPVTYRSRGHRCPVLI